MSVFAIPKSYTFEELKQAKRIMETLETKVSSDTGYSFRKYYIFNFCKAIEAQNLLVIEKLIKHDAFLIINQSVISSLARKALGTNNFYMVRMFFPHVKFLKKVVEKRLLFLSKNTCPFSDLVRNPYSGIFIDKRYFYAIDKLISIEDILDDNRVFKKFTGIEFTNKQDVLKIETFLGKKIDRETKKMFYKLMEDFEDEDTEEENNNDSTRSSKITYSDESPTCNGCYKSKEYAWENGKCSSCGYTEE